MSNRYTRVRPRKIKPKTSDAEKTDKKPLTEIPAGGRRSRRTMRKLVRVGIRLAVVTLLAIAVIAVWGNWDTIAPDGIEFMINDMLSGGGRGDGFPIPIAGGTALDMEHTSDGIVVLTDSSYILYNSKGGVVVNRQHSFAKPHLMTAGRWALIADLEGTSLRVETRSATAADITTENQILSASINRNGHFAVVTTSANGYAAEVIAYNKSAVQQYRWYTSDLLITDACISDNGKTMLVSGFSGENGAMKSCVLLFDLSSDQPVTLFSDTDQLIFHVRFLADGRIAAIGDKSVWTAGAKGESPVETSYDDHTLIGFALSDSTVTVALQHYGNTDGGLVTAVNSSGESLFTEAFDGIYRSLSGCQGGTYLLTSKTLYRTTNSGIKGSAEVNRDGQYVCELGRSAIILGLTDIKIIESI